MSTTVFALTSTFTPPASCLQTFYHYAQVVGPMLELGPSNVPDCLPPNYQSSSDFYYSPGVCPSGYVKACSSSVVIGSLTETRATCCPSNFNCQTQNILPWYTTLGCTLSSSFVTTGPLVSSSDTIAETFSGGINAYSVQIRWQSTDFPSTQATRITTVTVSVTPTNPASNQGLTAGSKVGIGIGVPFAIIVIGLLVWIGLILRKRSARTEPMAQVEAIPRFQDKVELPVFVPISEIAASGSTIRELP